MVEGKFRRCTRQMYSGGQEWSKLSKKISFKECHEALQADLRNVLNTKMYVVGVKNDFFLQRSKVAKLCRPNFIIVISSSAGGVGVGGLDSERLSRVPYCEQATPGPLVLDQKTRQTL